MGLETTEYDGKSVVPEEMPEDQIRILGISGERDVRYRISQCSRTPIDILERMMAEDEDDNIRSSAKANLALRNRGSNI